MGATTHLPLQMLHDHAAVLGSQDRLQMVSHLQDMVTLQGLFQSILPRVGTLPSDCETLAIL